MSLISDFDQRTAWKRERITGWFGTNPNVLNKVDPEGRYRTFPGTTVVFQCSEPMFEVISPLQDELHFQLAGSEMLAQRLPGTTFHMTLHDLVSPEQKTAHSLPDYFHEMDDSLRRAVEIVSSLRGSYRGKHISMTADHIVNMVSKSIVMLLKPVKEEDFELLLEMYHQFDEIVRLPYPLTPHITLAYFKPCMIDGDKLGNVVVSLNEKLKSLPVFEFSIENLTAQRFLDMKTYSNVY